jgi:DNA-binding Lrp family transcriptional regulator
MKGWWDELDEEILGILRTGEPMETTQLAAKLGMSPEAVGSCLAMLSTSGRVRIRSVEARPEAEPGMRAA